jgi:hypothetical protein
MLRFLKIFLLLLVITLLLTPMIQQRFCIIKGEAPLYGVFANSRDTSFTLSGWLNGSYQEAQDKYLNENFGFRNSLVRLYNQINFSIFKDINVKDVFRGKNDFLFSTYFFNNYSGRLFRGEQHFDSVMCNLQALNTELNKMNKKLLVCFAPCKESFFPEYLPDSCLPFISKRNHYSSDRKKTKAAGIPLLDLNRHFLNLKKQEPYPLFTQGAVHWTTNGAYLALDTLLKHIAFVLKKKINLIKLRKYELSDSPRDSDDDISKTMNLLQNINSEKLAYPHYDFTYTVESSYVPKTLIAGDSFFFGLLNTNLLYQAFSQESLFLYYSKKSMPFSKKRAEEDVNDIVLRGEIGNADLLLLFFSVGTLDRFGENVHSLMPTIEPPRN